MKNESLYCQLNEGKDAVRVSGFGYKLFTPNTLVSGEKYPLILFLHGAGERGDGTTQLDRVNVHGIPKYINAGMDIPAVVVAPQCPEGRVWPDMADELGCLLDIICAQLPIDEKRITVTGLSMGGYGTFTMGITFPGRFAALAPICGGGICWLADRLLQTPIWAFHGDADPLVPPTNSLLMFQAVKERGGKLMDLTLVHDCGHNSWEFAYERTKLIDWLLAAKLQG